MAGVQGSQEGVVTLSTTRDIRETLYARLKTDEEFRAALLAEAVEVFLSEDMETGRSVLHDLIDATVGFPTLAASLGQSEAGLIRLFSPDESPKASDLFSLISHLQKIAGVQLAVRAA
jgi:hypothetical protein